MSLIDLAGVFLVCATTLACFLIRSSHGTDVEEVHAEIEELKGLTAVIANLREVTTSNAKEFAAFRADVRTRMNLGPK